MSSTHKGPLMRSTACFPALLARRSQGASVLVSLGLSMALVAVVLAVAVGPEQAAADTESPLGLRQVAIDEAAEPWASYEISMNENRSAMGVVQLIDDVFGEARYRVLDIESSDSTNQVKRLIPPGVPESVDGSSQLSADGKTFVASYRLATDVASLCAGSAAPHYDVQQVVKWTRSTAHGEFGSPSLVTHQPVTGTDACDNRPYGAGPPLMGIGGDAKSEEPSVSRDGNVVAFVSAARNLGVAPTTVGRKALYVRTGTGAITMVTPAALNGDVGEAVMSANGLHIAFASSAMNIMGSGAAGSNQSVYLANRTTLTSAWTFDRASVSTAGTSVLQQYQGLSIDETGNRVAFMGGNCCTATALDPSTANTNPNKALFLRDVALARTSAVVNTSTTLAAKDFGNFPGTPVLTLDGNGLAMMRKVINETFARGVTTEIDPEVNLYDVTKVVSSSASTRQQARISHRTLKYRANPSGKLAIGGTGPTAGGGAAKVLIGFASINPPLERYADNPGSAYLLGGGAIGNPVSAPWHGDPVDVSTGNFSHQESDLAPPAGPAGAALTRAYSSFGDAAGLFGPGWATEFDLGLEVSSEDASTVTLVLPNGRRVTYLNNGTSWSTASGFRSTLTAIGTNFVLTDPAGSKRTFDADGRLVTIADKDQPAATIDWNAAAGVVVTTASGYSITLSDTSHPQWDGITASTQPGSDGYVDKATSSDGLVVDYGYSKFDGPIVLRTVSAPHRVNQVAGTYGVRTYETQRSRITKITDKVDAARSRTVVQNTYDALGRVVTQVNETGDTLTFHYGRKPAPPGPLAEAEGFVTVDNSASGDRVVYHYGPDGSLLGIQDANGNSIGRTWTGDQAGTATSRDGTTTANTYDLAGRIALTTATKSGTTRTVAGYTYVIAETAPTAKTDSRLATSTNAAGVVTTYVYDQAQSGSATQPWKVQVPCVAVSLAPGLTCPSGNKTTTTMTYGAGALDGLVTSSTDADGVRTDTAYDPTDRSITSVTMHPTSTSTLVTSYLTLHPGDTGWTETDPAVAMVQKVTGPGPSPAVTTTKFDGAGRMLEQRDPLYDGTSHKATRYQYWLTGDLKSVSDPADHVTTYDTRRPGDVGWSEAASIADVSIVTDPDGIESITKTDLSGDVVVEQTGKRSAPASLATTTHQYGTLGRLSRTVDPVGVVTQYAYDVEGRTTQTSAGPTLGDANHTTTNAYDQWGNLESVTGPASTDPDGTAVRSVTSYTYDDAGRTVTKIDGPAAAPASRLMTAYQYDAAGHLYRTIEHRAGSLDTANPFAIAIGDKVTESRYTLAGRNGAKTEPPVDQPLFNWASATDATKAITKYGYDGAGRPTTVTDPANHATTTTYDQAGNIETVTSRAGRVTTYGYDKAGNQISVTTPSGFTGIGQPATVTAQTAYGADGLVKSSTDSHVLVPGATDPSTRFSTYTPGGRLKTVTDAVEHTVTYGYDERGNRTSRSALNDAGAAVVQTWTYDVANRVKTSVAPPPRVGAAAMTTTNGYDPTYGWLSTITDPTGRVETRTSYNTGATKTQTWTQAGQPTVTAKSWVNDRGWQTKSTNQQGAGTQASSYTYDRAGQRLTALLPTAPAGDTLGYAWDLVGNATKLTYADGVVSTTTHTPTGMIDLVNFAATAVAIPVPYADYSYDLDDLRTNELLLAAGGSRNWTLNTAGQPTAFSEVLPHSAGGTQSYTAALTWRADGRQATEQVNTGSVATYAYDDAGQLTSVAGGPATGSWTYGTRGNRLTQTTAAGTTSYTTNPNGSVATATTGTKTSTFSYDDGGRRIGELKKAGATVTGTVTNSFDSRGKLAAATSVTGTTTEREDRLYDAAGLTVKSTSTVNGTVANVNDYIWDANRAVPEIMDVKTGGVLSTRAEYGAENPIGFNVSGYAAWFQYDTRDSVIRTDNTNYKLVGGPAAYDAWGVPTDPTSFFALSYRGEISTNSAIYLRNRDYDTTTGQFLTQDPLDGVDGTSTVANPYHYADNDPLNRADPLGLRSRDDDTFGSVAPKVMAFSFPVDSGFAGLGELAIGGFINQSETSLTPYNGPGPRLFKGDGRDFTPAGSFIPRNRNRFYVQVDFKTGRGEFQVNPTCRSNDGLVTFVPGPFGVERKTRGPDCDAPYPLVFGDRSDDPWTPGTNGFRRNYFVVQKSGSTIRLKWSVLHADRGALQDLGRLVAYGHLDISPSRSGWDVNWSGDCFPSLEVMHYSGGGSEVVGRLQNVGAFAMTGMGSKIAHFAGKC